jgi:pimeloyl-ACP methyl ester carboxylesterase
MGGMIATKLAAAAPERVCSLTLISTSSGGWQTIPHSWKGLRTGFRLLMARWVVCVCVGGGPFRKKG